jgi:hypothetical protein
VSTNLDSSSFVESMLNKNRHLASGACYTAELKFLALSAGVLGLEAVRIVDLATQEIVDVRDLPSIVAAEKEA